MDDYETRQLVNRILSGYTFVGKYILDIPSAQLLAQADNIHANFLYENRFEGILRESHTKILLIKHGLWSLFEDNTLNKIPKELEATKLNLYNSLLVPSRQRRVRDQLAALKAEYNKLYAKRSVFDQYTIEFLADYTREHFIFSNIILNNNYKKIIVRPVLVDKIMAQSKKNDISIKKYRELARSEYWRSIWDATNTSSFRQIGEEQRSLISFTSLYENIAKHPEAPSQAVINDDDMLDGWMIYIRQKQEKEKKEQDFEKSKPEKSKGNEHFIMTSPDPEDIKSVLDLNDPRGRIIQKKIHTMVKQDGVANEFNIQEIQQDAKINYK